MPAVVGGGGGGTSRDFYSLVCTKIVEDQMSHSLNSLDLNKRWFRFHG